MSEHPAPLSLAKVAWCFALLGLLALASVPLLRHWTASSRATSLASDLRNFSKAFNKHLEDTGDWPGQIASKPGTFPESMASYLQGSNWIKPSPLGGHYVWQSGVRHNGRRIRAAILIEGASLDPANRSTLLTLDKLIDDGNLSTGSFRLGFSDAPLLILEP